MSSYFKDVMKRVYDEDLQAHERRFGLFKLKATLSFPGLILGLADINGVEFTEYLLFLVPIIAGVVDLGIFCESFNLRRNQKFLSNQPESANTSISKHTSFIEANPNPLYSLANLLSTCAITLSAVILYYCCVDTSLPVGWSVVLFAVACVPAALACFGTFAMDKRGWEDLGEDGPNPASQSNASTTNTRPESPSPPVSRAIESGLRFIRVHINEQPYWEYVTRTNSAEGVTIVAVTQQQEILVVKQHRIPLDADVIELPAGLVGDKDRDETPEQAAAKELREETGYVVEPANIRLLAKGPALPGLTDEINGLYLASDVVKVDSGGGEEEEGERIAVFALPLSSVMEQLRVFETQGCKVDLKVYAGLHFLRNAQRTSPCDGVRA